MAIKDFYPAVRPTLDLNFAGSETVDPRITFSRATNVATYFDRNGVIKTALINVPRIDFDPVTGECKGLLIEEQRTNLLQYSEQFDNSYWIKRGTTSVTANAAIAPSGELTADLLSGIYNGGLGDIYRGITTTANSPISPSFWIKKVSASGIFRIEDPNNRLNGRFDIDLALIGDGWERITESHPAVTVVTPFVSNSSGLTGFMIMTPHLTPLSFYAWGAQVEAGAFPTSYIPTTTAQVTRAAESASMTGANFSSWYRQDEGTIFALYSRMSDKAGGSQIPLMASDGTQDNFIAITDSANGSSDRVLVGVGGVSQANIGSFNYIANQTLSRAIAYKVDDLATAINGGNLATDSAGLVPTVNQLTIGYAPYFSSSRVNGHIRRIAYYHKRLSNTNLQALTA